MAKFEKRLTGDFNSILDRVHSGVMNGGLSMNLVDESNYTMDKLQVAVRVYDKYFMRNGNRASLSLTVVGEEEAVFISAIGAGGGSGVFFNFSLGAESDMVDLVKRCVDNLE